MFLAEAHLLHSAKLNLKSTFLARFAFQVFECGVFKKDKAIKNQLVRVVNGAETIKLTWVNNNALL